MSKINAEQGRWQEWRGDNNPVTSIGRTVSPSPADPRIPEQTRGSVPSTLSTRLALRDFAKGRSERVQMICWRLRHALRQSERCDSPALREMIQLDTAALAACR